MIGVVLMYLNIMCGAFALITYSANVFQASGSSLDPFTCSIVFAIFQLVGTCLASQLVDKVGRKALLILSLVGSSFGLSTMGAYQYLYEQGHDVSAFDWIPVVSLSFVVTVASIGILPLPFVILAEILPQKLRAVMSSICMLLLSFIAFTTLKFFPIMLEIIGLHGCMWVFATSCTAGTFFVIFVMDETKGKVLDVIRIRSRANSIAPC